MFSQTRHESFCRSPVDLFSTTVLNTALLLRHGRASRSPTTPQFVHGERHSLRLSQVRSSPLFRDTGIILPIAACSIYCTLTDAYPRLTSASKNFMLHLLPSQTNSSFAPPSTLIALVFAAATIILVTLSRRPGTPSCGETYASLSTRTHRSRAVHPWHAELEQTAWISFTPSIILRSALLFVAILRTLLALDVPHYPKPPTLSSPCLHPSSCRLCMPSCLPCFCLSLAPCLRPSY